MKFYYVIGIHAVLALSVGVGILAAGDFLEMPRALLIVAAVFSAFGILVCCLYECVNLHWNRK